MSGPNVRAHKTTSAPASVWSGLTEMEMLRSAVSTRNFGSISTVLLLAQATMTTALRPTSVRADEQGFKGTLTVQFTVTNGTNQQCASGDGICIQCTQNSGFYVEAQGIAETTLGPLFAKVLKCFNPTPSPPKAPYGTYAGTMTLSVTPPVTPPSVIPLPKDILTLVYSGQNDDGGDFYGFQPFSGKLTVKSGAGKFQGAQGAIAFIAQSGPFVAASLFGATTSPFSMTGNAFYDLQGTIEGVGP